MILYRNELPTDEESIARIHALSWQRHYAGIFDPIYLEQRVFDDRKIVWRKRFSKPEPDRLILIAEVNGEMAGFACTYLSRNEIWGALLDNLHVLREYQGNGIGLQLMQKTFDWIKEKDSCQDLYLGVLVKNIPSRNFYLSHGGKNVGQFSEISPAGNQVTVDWMLWKERPAKIPVP